MISGREPKRSVQSRLRLKTVEGTTLAMIAWSILSGSILSRRITWSSQTAYSSEVLRASVAARQAPFFSKPSKTAKTVLVFPASIARSMMNLLGQAYPGRIVDIWLQIANAARNQPVPFALIIQDDYPAGLVQSLECTRNPCARLDLAA